MLGLKSFLKENISDIKNSKYVKIIKDSIGGGDLMFSLLGSLGGSSKKRMLLIPLIFVLLSVIQKMKKRGLDKK